MTMESLGLDTFGDGARGGVVQPHRASVARMVASLHRTSDGTTKHVAFTCPFNPANHDLARPVGPASRIAAANGSA